MEGAYLLKNLSDVAAANGNNPHVDLILGVPGFSRNQYSQVSFNGGYLLLLPNPSLIGQLKNL